MDIRLDLVKIEGINNPGEIYRNLMILFSTIEGEVPFDREFGISPDIIDLPLEAARNRLAVEYSQKVRRYEPRVQVQSVDIETDPVQGILRPKVVVELAE